MCVPAMHPMSKFYQHEAVEGLRKSLLLPKAIELAYCRWSKLKHLVPEVKLINALSISLLN